MSPRGRVGQMSTNAGDFSTVNSTNILSICEGSVICADNNFFYCLFLLMITYLYADDLYYCQFYYSFM